MIPFGVKILWFILSLVGLIGSWTVLWAFGRVTGVKWGPLLWCIGNTLVQGILCLGMAYSMDPVKMHPSFCYAQKLVISIGVYLMSAMVLVFSFATSLAVMKPKTWDDATRALKWRPTYTLPVVFLPLLGTSLYAGLLFKFKPMHPNDGILCDGTTPEWMNLLSPSSLPFVFCAPIVLYQSIISIRNIKKTKQHLFRSRPESGVEYPSECNHKKSWSGGMFQWTVDHRPRGMSLTLPVRVANKKPLKSDDPQVVTLKLNRVAGASVARKVSFKETRRTSRGGRHDRLVLWVPFGQRSAKARKTTDVMSSEDGLPSSDGKVKADESPGSSNPEYSEEYAQLAAELTGDPPVRYSVVGRTSSRFSALEGELDMDDVSSRVSSSFPNFVNDDSVSWRPAVATRRRLTEAVVLEGDEEESGTEIANALPSRTALQQQLTQHKNLSSTNTVADPDATINDVEFVASNFSTNLGGPSSNESFHTAENERRNIPSQLDDNEAVSTTFNKEDDSTRVDIDIGSAVGNVLEFSSTTGNGSKTQLGPPDFGATLSTGGQEGRDLDLASGGLISEEDDDRFTRKPPASHSHSRSMSSHTKRTPTSMTFSVNNGPFKRRREPAHLSPAIYYLIIFQFYFSFLQLVSFFSPLHHSVGGSSVPPPYMAHYVALMLAEWGSIVIFGLLPDVRHSLIPWRPVAGPTTSLSPPALSRP